MRHLLFVALAVLSFSGLWGQNSQLNKFLDETDSFLKANVSNGLIDYDGIRKSPSQLNGLVETIASFPIGKLSSTEKQAFYINTYNIIIIKSVLAHPGISSPLDVAGFFKEKTHKVAGESLTLDAIEKQKLLAASGDSRLHFVLVCAAKGCPPLAPFAYRPNKLEQQLEERTRATLNSSDFIRISSLDEVVGISEIFKWYYQDFDARSASDARALTGYINKYRNTPLPSDHSIEYYQYDWKLNKQ